MAEQTVTIDGQSYQLDQMSDEAKNQLASLRVTDQEISRLQTQLAIAKTARNAYAKALSEQLPSSSND